MDKVTLYGLSHEYVELYKALVESADSETGEVDVDIISALEKVQGAFEEKAISTACVFRAMGNYASEIKAEIDRLTALKRHVEREQKRLEDYLSQACERTGTESIRGIYANIMFRNNPPKTIIDDESKIPEEYMTVKVERKPNLNAIKEAIKEGKEVAGAHLESERKIQIK